MNLFPRPKPQTSCNSCTLLPVDAAYAYDYLAILYVKKDAGLPVTNEIERIETFLKIQHPNMSTVLSSTGFKRLLVANQLVFDAIEKAHHNKIQAREVQRINMLRFTAKKKLQQEFWPMTGLNETKTTLGKI